jgi:Tol biopolymer transport system component/imidazolonepropionase-like amidohydrolase
MTTDPASRLRFPWPALLAAAVLCVAAASGVTHAKKDPDGAKEEEKPKWDVSNPPGTWRSIEIHTDETTWSDVDVSPDGRTILFDMLGDLYTVPISGGDAVSLTSGIPWDFQARFSPDGRRIAFVSDRSGADNLWVMQADGAAPRAVSEERENLVHNPSWSPDGDWVVAKKGFTSTRSIPAGEIWLFHAGGGSGLVLVERPNKEKDQKNIAEPSFSPDGRYVYYSQDITPGLRWEYDKDSTGRIFAIKRLERATGEVVTYVDGPGGAIRPTPSPDGRSLAFVKRLPTLESALYVKDLASGLELPVYTALERDLQETTGSQGNTTAFDWTPDSRSIVFWAGGKIRRLDVATREVAVIPIRIRTERKVAETLRFPVDVAPERFPVRMIRWAQLSPDGSRVVFQALGQLWIRDAAGGAPRRLTAQNDHFEQWPAFSRDGRSIVYTTWDDEELGSIRVVPVEGGASRVVSREPGHYVEPRFSPDGSRIVYRKIAGGYLVSGNWSMEPGIYVVAVDGGEPKRLSRSGTNGHFGADGERVYFSDVADETHLVLKSVALDGHDERTHLDGATATEFSVSPDGRWVAFTEQFNAWVAPHTATGRKVEIGSASKGVPVKQVSKRAGESLHWSASARSLSWAHGATLYTRELKDAFAFLEGAPAELPEPATTGLDLSFTVDADRPAGTIALVGARVVTLRDARSRQEVIEDGVVLVEGNRIRAVGPRSEVAVPAGARVFELAGKTILPGLIDVHAHGAMAIEGIVPEQNWGQYSSLAFGVTTIHDPSNDTSSIFAAAELQRAGRTVGPRVFSTGTILYGAHAPGYHARIEDLDEALFHVRRLKDVGAISVKSYQQPRRDQRQQVIEAGRQLGIMVVPEGGAKFEHNMTEIVDGHTGIEHAIPLKRAYDDVLQLWSQTGTGYTPTLGVAYGGLAGENWWYEHDDVWQNSRLMSFAPRSVVEPRSMRRTKAPETHYNHVHVAAFARELVERGGRVQVGAHGQREGLAAHWEIRMLAQGGFTPWEAIRAATIDGAHYLGMDPDLGSIEPGKLADLAVIDGNPLADLSVSERVAYTMINGRLYESATMNQLAPDAVERRPFFFEREGGDTIHPATLVWLERLRERYGWVH